MKYLSSIRRSECLNHVQHPYFTLTSKVLCKKGVKGVEKPIFWYSPEKSQTHHKLMGTSCICCNVSLERIKQCICGRTLKKSRWLGQSGVNHLDISRTCVCVFNFVFWCFCFLVWNRNTVQIMKYLSSVRLNECLNHVQHPYFTLTSEVLCKKGVKGIAKQSKILVLSMTVHNVISTSCILHLNVE